MLTPNDVLNFYLNTPPFEITDMAQYTNIIEYAKNQTLIELSENSPILEEKTFTTPQAQNNEEYVLVDIYTTIHQNLLEILYLKEKNNISNDSLIPFSIDQYLNNDNSSILNLIAIRDGIHLLKKYTSTYIQKLIYQNKYIKLLPETEYYVLFERYLEIDELTPTDMLTFTELFEINLYMRVFQSSTFSTEQGIRSVSISGLSVTLNVPTTEQAIKMLSSRKNKLLYSHSTNDYDELIGHF